MLIKEISLNNCRWQVKGFWPYIPFLGKSMETGNEMMGVTDWVDASVPGGIHADLLRAGVIEDPYYEMNSVKCEWIENRWWQYRTTFTVEEGLREKRLKLIFKGVDYNAHFYLNRQKLGEHEGMFEPVCFDITGLVKFAEDNLLEVLFESVPDEMSQIGYTSGTRTQKSRFAYKWDWCTRLVNIGLWDDVIIKPVGLFVFEQFHITTDIVDKTGLIHTSANILTQTQGKCTVDVSIHFGELLLEQWSTTYNTERGMGFILNKEFKIKNPQLWYPNGLGEQPLYTVRIDLKDGEDVSDTVEVQTGIRKLEYRRNQESPEDSLPYTVVINHRPVYLKGINLAPFDQMYGTVTEETYDKYLKLLKIANVNLVRVNGVGVIEKESFYRLCDKYGIMVWQDFIQSSSGIENVPPVDSGFLKLLKETAVSALTVKRNHVSHVIWCGGNELTDENRVPITYDHPNIRMLKDLADKYDPGKLFLPSTSSGPIFDLDINQPGKNHDVHGSWKYEGIERHYHLYNHSDALFHSEFGADGMSSLNSLEKFLSTQNIKITNMKENLVWRHHGEWWDTLSRDEDIFGKFESLEDFIKASQFMQAEGIRYIVEANRRRKFKNSGSMLWQFNEAWPNISNTCVVDYYGVPKMAYYWLKQAYAPIHASLSYDKLFFSTEEEFKAKLFLHNSLELQKLTVNLEILDARGDRLYFENYDRIMKGNNVEMVVDMNRRIPDVPYGIFFIRILVCHENGSKLDENLYLFSQMKTNIFKPLFDIKKASFTVTKETAGFRARNTGDSVCLFINGYGAKGCGNVFVDGNYSSLFPGEEKIFRVIPVGISNLQNEDYSILWDCFNK